MLLFDFVLIDCFCMFRLSCLHIIYLYMLLRDGKNCTSFEAFFLSFFVANFVILSALVV